MRNLQDLHGSVFKCVVIILLLIILVVILNTLGIRIMKKFQVRIKFQIKQPLKKMPLMKMQQIVFQMMMIKTKLLLLIKDILQVKLKSGNLKILSREIIMKMI